MENKEYEKIQNVFRFDEKYRTIQGIMPPFNQLSSITWIATEKVDGTNTRIYWDGHRITFAGRTDRAELPKEVLENLSNIFLSDETTEYVFEQMFGDKCVVIYGESYGPKIQNDGALYSDKTEFIVFDIKVDGFDLDRINVVDIANRLGLKYVPVVYEGTLNEIITFVKQHPSSTINSNHEMEGVVIEPQGLILYTKDGRRVKGKVKYRDMLKTNYI